MKILAKFLAAAFALACSAVAAHAQYPERPITLVIPYGAGGATDIAGRNLASVTPKYVPQPVLPVNRTGAGGVTGTASVANAEPDGYTMMVARVGSHTVNPAMKATLPYSIEDFDYIGVFEINPVVCAVSAESDIESMDDLVSRIKENPGSVSYSSSGVGSLLHLSSPLVIDAYGVEKANEALIHLPFRGGGAAATAVITGNADFICTNSSALAGHIKNGVLRPLLVTTEEPVPGIDAPTVNELGHPELNALVGWSGIAGPKGLPEEVKTKWGEWLQKVGEDEDFLKKARDLGSVPVQMSVQESIDFINNQYEVFRELVVKLGMEVE
ncbi:Bug family tripartite tricarboxylate transporter substrate binding protein [Dichotomicrobium thermohalophilum]|uniref:Tripartite-type tricarboxylate transporter receptor subunit TctC n=1 Tax=Dichotomicrobium thermohalophilum TaxID=933063 RepID=A0A397PDX2_9HYPH|nr:tripartite tricarboxylate transporter substrate binding protein [Dichotomicrobium thermohalophilum]RIA45367.1 tripartite-type tricarboxylate transporter receptor subunit TctC [Dichotomicrobium thermohalophilum]